MSYVTMRIFTRILEEGSKSSEIHVFDFDDTLVRTNSRIYVTHADGSSSTMNPREYAAYRRHPNDIFDYSDFEQVIEPILMTGTFLRLKRSISEVGENNVFILTARGNPDPVAEYMSSVGVDGIRVFATGTSDPRAKAQVIRNEVLSRAIRRVYVYDDAAKNIDAVRNLRKSMPGVDIITVRMK